MQLQNILVKLPSVTPWGDHAWRTTQDESPVKRVRSAGLLGSRIRIQWKGRNSYYAKWKCLRYTVRQHFMVTFYRLTNVNVTLSMTFLWVSSIFTGMLRTYYPSYKARIRLPRLRSSLRWGQCCFWWHDAIHSWTNDTFLIFISKYVLFFGDDIRLVNVFIMVFY